jgi:SAM-dependent methyltransferase
MDNTYHGRGVISPVVAEGAAASETGSRDPDYYSMLKVEFLEVIPRGPHVVLDMGCASGQLGRALKESNRAAEMVGAEIYPPAAEEAGIYYDKVFQGDVESLILPYTDYFDYVICGDILEHLKDPWAMLANIHRMLKDGGSLICSIPNIRYWQIIVDLVLKGKWQYAPDGILDITHLRFFTRKSFLDMLNKADLSVTWLRMSIHGKKIFANAITCGMFSEFLATQIMIAARKTGK